jgi:hypothetical protein
MAYFGQKGSAFCDLPWGEREERRREGRSSRSQREGDFASEILLKIVVFWALILKPQWC